MGRMQALCVSSFKILILKLHHTLQLLLEWGLKLTNELWWELWESCILLRLVTH